MKKTLFALVAISALVLFAFKPGEGEEKYPTIALGEEMPMADEPLTNIDEKEYSLNDLKGENGTLVIFSCNTCPFVIQWEDRYDDVVGIANRLNIGSAYINSNEAKRTGDDSFDMMVEHAKEAKYQAPYLVDSKSQVANAFGAKTTPHVFLFNANNELVYKGAIDDNSKDASAVTQQYLKDALFALGNGEEIEVAQTDAKGCSIKRVK